MSGLVVIETHPIQYHAPVYRCVSQNYGVPVTSIYGSDFSMAGYRDEEFAHTFAWDTDLLSGTNAIFLSKASEDGAANVRQVKSDGLRSALLQAKPSAVLIVGYGHAFHRAAFLESMRLGCPVFFRGETSDLAYSRGWMKSIARDAALRMYYSRFTKLLYIGRRSKEHYERLGVPAERLRFSPYCVDESTFETDDESRKRFRESKRAELGFSSDEFVIIFSGKLSHRKGVDLLVPAVKRMQNAGMRASLLFLGQGECKEQLSKQSQEAGVKSVFAGFQNQKKMSAFYHASDVLVLPSRSEETWGLVVNEALHHGLPCVVSDAVGCAPDLVLPGRSGEIFSSNSSDALSGALQAVHAYIGTTGIRETCRNAVSGYTVQVAASGIFKAYQEAVS
jgi:glycosyltransferase involved in cell wall biosynthesis